MLPGGVGGLGSIGCPVGEVASRCAPRGREEEEEEEAAAVVPHQVGTGQRDWWGAGIGGQWLLQHVFLPVGCASARCVWTCCPWGIQHAARGRGQKTPKTHGWWLRPSRWCQPRAGEVSVCGRCWPAVGGHRGRRAWGWLLALELPQHGSGAGLISHEGLHPTRCAPQPFLAGVEGAGSQPGCGAAGNAAKRRCLSRHPCAGPPASATRIARQARSQARLQPGVVSPAPL